MRDNVVYALVSQLHQRFNRKINDLAADDYMDVLGKYPLDIVKIAIKNIRKREKTLPTPMEVGQYCKEITSYFEKKDPLPSELVCKYQEQGESEISRKLCVQVTQQDIDAARVQGWETVCAWHYSILYAEVFPDSIMARMLEQTLKDRKQASSWDGGELEIFGETIGFDPLRYNRNGRWGENRAQKSPVGRQIFEIVKDLYSGGGHRKDVP